MKKAETAQDDFLGNLFLVGKNDGGNRLVTNLKKLYTFIPYEYFEKKCLHGLNFLLEKNDFLFKIDLKDSHFAIPLSKLSSKYVRFKLSGNLYEFLCRCLGSAPKVFTKLLKILIALLRRIDI